MGIWAGFISGIHTAISSHCSHLCLSKLGKLVIIFVFNKRLRCLSLIFSLWYICLKLTAGHSDESDSEKGKGRPSVVPEISSDLGISHKVFGDLFWGPPIVL